MNYLQKSKEPTGRNKFLRTILIIGVCAIAFSIFAPNLFSGTLRNTAAPLWSFKEGLVGNSYFGAMLKSKSNLVRRNQALERALSEANATLFSYQSLGEENERMRQALNALGSRNAVWADVLARPPVSLYDTFVIRTLSSKVEVSQKVLAHGSVPIGEVAEVNNGTALVRLYSAPGNNFSAELQSGETIEVVGRGNGSFQSSVPKAVKAEQGEKLFFAGTREPLGTIKVIEEKDSDSFKTLHIESPINIYKLKSVQILI